MYIMSPLLGDRAKFHCATPVTSDQTHYPSKYIFHHRSQREHSNFNEERVKTHKTLIRRTSFFFLNEKNNKKQQLLFHVFLLATNSLQTNGKTNEITQLLDF